MEIVRTILTVVYFIVALVVIILALIQSKEDSGCNFPVCTAETGK